MAASSGRFCLHSDGRRCSDSCDRIATEPGYGRPFERHSVVEELAGKGVHMTVQRRAVLEIRTRRDHAHLACLECGQIEEFSSSLLDQLKSAIARQSGFELRITRLEAAGVCSGSKANQKAG